MCHDTEKRCKISRGIYLSFQNWHEEFDEVHKQSTKCLSQKRIEELYLMALETDASYEGKLTFAFQNDMRNLANFQTEK